MDWGRMSRAERDASYNNSAAVPERDALTAERIAASKAFRDARPGHLDLAYGPGERNKWDLFPGDDPKSSLLGLNSYWQGSNREGYSCLAEGVLSRGWSAALPRYTLAPAATSRKGFRVV